MSSLVFYSVFIGIALSIFFGLSYTVPAYGPPFTTALSYFATPFGVANHFFDMNLLLGLGTAVIGIESVLAILRLALWLYKTSK